MASPRHDSVVSECDKLLYAVSVRSWICSVKEKSWAASLRRMGWMGVDETRAVKNGGGKVELWNVVTW